MLFAFASVLRICCSAVAAAIALAVAAVAIGGAIAVAVAAVAIAAAIAVAAANARLDNTRIVKYFIPGAGFEPAPLLQR